MFGGMGMHSGYRRRPHYYCFGGSYFYISPVRTRAISILGVFAVILFIVAIGGLFNAFGAQSNISTIKYDYHRYQGMIALGWETNAQVTGYDRLYGIDKYYIKYEISYGSGSKLRGESYSVYTLARAIELNHTTIVVALGTPPANINSGTDSIPVDYATMSLTDDGEYNALVSKRSGGFTTAGIAGGIFGVAFVLCPLLAFRKRTSEDAANISTAPNTVGAGVNGAKAGTTAAGAGSNTTYCPYCGTPLDINERKCPNCGASARQGQQQ
jgi:hypothetical protein